ncbi:hypothetical protein AJ78_04629 [Emergomyces pasteurianus Ep9510]|uniref:Uncharacterized protein n=1 Tax=Emergomyces pasteurianus Ep9510 TaxID=1447872 RepID=A0A1J9PGP7_9EURO|nr:hypothetical protein AJ78_04629 [Emergomyces pasteurianus Ep9510]
MPLSDLDIQKANKLFDLNGWAHIAVTQVMLPLPVKSKGTSSSRVPALSNSGHIQCVKVHNINVLGLNAAGTALWHQSRQWKDGRCQVEVFRQQDTHHLATKGLGLSDGESNCRESDGV